MQCNCDQESRPNNQNREEGHLFLALLFLDRLVLSRKFCHLSFLFIAIHIRTLTKIHNCVLIFLKSMDNALPFALLLLSIETMLALKMGQSPLFQGLDLLASLLLGHTNFLKYLLESDAAFFKPTTPPGLAHTSIGIGGLVLWSFLVFLNSGPLALGSIGEPLEIRGEIANVRVQMP